MRVKPYLGLLLLTLFLAGCSWFSDEDEIVREPAVLLPIKEEVQLQKLWDTRIGRGADDKEIKLVPAFTGSRVFAASADGTVKALDSGTGRQIWQLNIKDFYSDEEARNSFSDSTDTITGGVGVGVDLVIVGSGAGEIVAMNQSDGTLAWRAKTTSEVLAPPQARDRLVVAQSIDGRVAGFDALDGQRRWLYSATIPSLTLRGTSTPLLMDGVMAGFANGRVVVLDKERGLPVIDQRIAASQGKSDLERLIDIDGLMVRDGNILYVASYQGNLAAVDLANNGRIRWMKPASTSVGLGFGFGNVYLSTEDSEIMAYDVNAGGKEVWANIDLLYRDITAPTPVSSYVAIGDFEGYLHLVAQSDGRFVARRKIDSAGIRAPIVADGARMYVMGNSGHLTALELR